MRFMQAGAKGLAATLGGACLALTLFASPAFAADDPTPTSTTGEIAVVSPAPSPSVTSSPAAPNVPSDLQWVKLSTTSAKLSWTAPGADDMHGAATTYKVQMRVTGEVSQTDTVTDTSMTYTKLSPGDTVTATVTAVNDTGASSEVAAPKWTQPAVKPGAPASASISNVEGTSFTVTWTAPTSTGGAAITSYMISVRDATNDKEYYAKEFSGNTFTDTIMGLDYGTEYYFTVAAVNNAGKSAIETSESATTTNKPVQSSTPTPSVTTVTEPPITETPSSSPSTSQFAKELADQRKSVEQLKSVLGLIAIIIVALLLVGAVVTLSVLEYRYRKSLHNDEDDQV